MSLNERWVLLRHEGGRLIAYPAEYPPAEPIPHGWEQVEVVLAEHLRGAVEALEHIAESAAHPSLTVRSTDYIGKVARDALDAIARGQ